MEQPTPDLTPLPDPYVPSANAEGLAQPLMPPTVPPRPRIVFALVVPLIAIVGSVFLTVVMMGVALVISPPENMGVKEFEHWIEQTMLSPLGIFALVLPSQVAMLGAALGAAWFSREPFHQRLALGLGEMSLWTWVLLVMGTPFIGMVSSMVLTQFMDEPSEQLKMLEKMFASGTGPMAVLMMITFTAVPGLCEELLFRGYCQTRLHKRWPPAAAIAVSSIYFTAAHMDPMHAIGVLPLGVWLSLVAWRTGSVWPAVLCHAANNLLAVLASRYGDPTEDASLWTTETILVAAMFGLFFVASCIVLFLRPGAVSESDELRA